MLRVSEIQICLKVRLFAILEEPRRQARARGGACAAWRSPGCRSPPSLRNKYIHHCTNILIQNNTVPSVRTVCVGKDRPSEPSHSWTRWSLHGAVRRSWLFGLRGTLPSTQWGSRGQSGGTGCTSIPGPKPRLGACGHSRGHPAAPAGRDRSAWPGGLGAGGHRPLLFGASWAGRRAPRGLGLHAARPGRPPCP